MSAAVELGHFNLRITAAEPRPVNAAGARHWYLFVDFMPLEGTDAGLVGTTVTMRYRLDSAKGKARIRDLAAAAGWGPTDGELDPDALVGRTILAYLVEQDGEVRVVGRRA